jgi:hypothetical protein
MAIQYAGGTNINTTFAAGTRTQLVDNLKAELVNAGWSVASGSSGDWKLDSATTPAGHNYRVRLWDPGSGNCAQVRIMNQAETLAPNQSVWLLPGTGKVYRVLANKYQFHAFVPASSNSREYAGAGVLCVPSFLSTTNACWLGGNGQSDTDSNIRTCFRTNNCFYDTAQAWIYGNVAGSQNSGWIPSAIRLVHLHDPHNQSNNSYRWADDSFDVYDAVMAFGTAGGNTEAKKVGLLWDAFLCSGDFAADTTVTFDSKTFMCVTVSLSGSNRGSLFVYAP